MSLSWRIEAVPVWLRGLQPLSADALEEDNHAANEHGILKAMPDRRKIPTLEPMPELPPGYDPARADHIRELWEAVHATDDPKEQERLWAELGEYILGPSH